MNHRQKLAGEKSNAVSKFFVYLLMAVLTAVIVVPVAWVFMASVKQNSEFYGNPFALPEGLYLQNFADAWTKARMGDYFFILYHDHSRGAVHFAGSGAARRLCIEPIQI